jgi:hypothetical protein
MLGQAYAEIGARLARHVDRIDFGRDGFSSAVEWYRTGSIDEEHYLNQVDIAFPVTARAGGGRVLE